MANFDPFANQGGPAAWDPEHNDDSKKLTDALLKKLSDEDDETGAKPVEFSDDDIVGPEWTGDDDLDDDSADYDDSDEFRG